MNYYKIICWTECPFCIKAKNLLIEKDIQFEYCSVDHSMPLLNHYKEIYNHKTVPMIIKINTESKSEEFIGGYSELRELLRTT